MTTAKTKVNVRMYCQGLGDCFLVTFTTGTGKTRVLIDCGVVLGSPGGTDKTREVVTQLAIDCENRLDVVVATHEHWDHVSGFSTAKEIFEGIQIDEIWLAWTENPKDKQAKRIRAERAARTRKLRVAVAAWKKAVAVAALPDARLAKRAKRAIQTTTSLLNFFGPSGAPTKGAKTREALDYLKDNKAPKRYLEPGDCEAIPGTKDVRVFVLGPPREEAMIKKESPSKRAPETYEDAPRMSASSAFLAALPASAGDGDAGQVAAEAERYQPFDVFHRIPETEAPFRDFFRTRYGFDGDTAEGAAEDPLAWRRIGHDWLATTAELALQLDQDTNNTSLVLAFEVGDGGDVFLFAADAQVGNWLSWETVAFAGSDVTSDDLLARTIFYKVGHHASHNATLRENGLEKMTSRRLTAAIPVVQETAKNIGWGRMPFGPLLERLGEKCRHRVVRMDLGVDPEAGSTFKKQVAQGDLYFDLTFD